VQQLQQQKPMTDAGFSGNGVQLKQATAENGNH